MEQPTSNISVSKDDMHRYFAKKAKDFLERMERQGVDVSDIF